MIYPAIAPIEGVESPRLNGWSHEKPDFSEQYESHSCREICMRSRHNRGIFDKLEYLTVRIAILASLLGSVWEFVKWKFHIK